MADKQSDKISTETLKGFSHPAERALATIGVTRLSQLTKYTEQEILNLHGMGPKGIRVLKAALQEKGLSFKQQKKKRAP